MEGERGDGWVEDGPRSVPEVEHGDGARVYGVQPELFLRTCRDVALCEQALISEGRRSKASTYCALLDCNDMDSILWAIAVPDRTNIDPFVQVPQPSAAVFRAGND